MVFKRWASHSREQSEANSKPQNTTSSQADGLTINAPTSVSIQGTSFSIGGSSTVHFSFGSQINQAGAQHSLHSLIENLTRSHNAEFDIVANTARGPCTPGTRITILEKLVNWCNSSQKPLYWMSGMAGTGKTTISYSLSDMLAAANLLGASFFCSRSLPDCRDVNIIFPTIAFQLARKYPPYAEELATSLSADPDLLRRPLATQFLKLIAEPWGLRQSELPQHIVVVIDALDECDKNHAIFLNTLFDHAINGLLPFKILMTSRPEPSVRDILQSKDPTILSTFILHEVEKDLVQADIALFIRDKLAGRVTEAELQYATNLCGVLFIFAATLVRFLTVRNANVSARIEHLKRTISKSEKKNALSSIDVLYRDVLSVALHPGLLDTEAEEIRQILFTIVCAREPLTRDGLAALWKTTVEEVNRRLDPLRSIIFVPEGDSQVISVFHASFPDFMSDPSRSGKFFCYPKSVNTLLSRRCMMVFQDNLKPNLCNAANCTFNDALPHVGKTMITPGLRYASIYLVEHCVRSGRSDFQTILDVIHKLITIHLLCWIECLSHIGKLVVSVRSLEMIQSTFEQRTKLSFLAGEARRMVLYFYDTIHKNPIFIYSAFTWIPTDFNLRYYNTRIHEQVPRLLGGYVDSWTGPERVIEVDCGDIYSIAVSHDGSQLVYGCDDKTIRIWNISEQIQQGVLLGHTGQVNCVAIFEDGNRVVSGSEDKSVRIWNMSTLQASTPMESPTAVRAIAISRDEKWVASGHLSVVHLWNVADGSLTHIFEGHTDWVRSLSFIPNTTSLISASDDKTARIWGVQTKRLKRALYHNNEVISIACSDVGDKVISVSRNSPVRIWDTSGNELRILPGDIIGPTSETRAVAFLPGGGRIVIGSSDGILSIRDVNTGDVVRRLTGARDLTSVAVFRDGQRIASSSSNRLSIWNLEGGEAITGSGFNGKVDETGLSTTKYIALSPDGQRALLLPSLCILDITTLKKRAVTLGVARSFLPREWWTGQYRICALSISESKVAIVPKFEASIEVWDLSSDLIGRKVRSLQGHTALVSFLSFSSDGRQLASSALDNTVRIWDSDTGNQIQSFPHGNHVHYPSFSPDNTRIITTADDTIQIWDVRSGRRLRSFSRKTYTASFSADDQYVVAYYDGTTTILDPETKTGKVVSEYDGYYFGSPESVEDRSSYVLQNDGWICRLPSADRKLSRLVWIPTPYRPIINSSKVNRPSLISTPQGIRLVLQNQGRVLIVHIPPSNKQP